MNKVNVQNKKFVKSFILISLALVLVVALCVAIVEFSNNRSIAQADTSNVETLQKETPKGFEPQIILNKYIGAECDIDNDEIVINYPRTYNEDKCVLPNGIWYAEQKSNNFYLDTSKNSSINLIELKKDNELNTYSLLVENQEDEKTFSSFEMEATSEVISHIKNKARSVNTYSSTSIENTVAFYDAKITYINPWEDFWDQVSYNVADLSWNEYSEDELTKLKEFTSDEKKFKNLKLLTERAVISGKSLDAEIFKYIPKSVIYKEGKSVFIGQNYGFIYSAVDKCKRYNSENGFFRYYRSNGERKTMPYSFDPEHCELEVNLIIFSFESELVGREFKSTTNILFNSENGKITNIDSLLWNYGKEIIDICNNDSNKLFLADPSFSASVRNKYDLKSNDATMDIGFAQTRINFNGYTGIKTNSYKEAETISTGIISPAELREIILNSCKEADFDNSNFWRDLIFNGFRFSYEGLKFGLAVESIDCPILGVIDAALFVYDTISEFINNYAVTYDTALANNEKNILTFPAPSKGLTKDIISVIGIEPKLNRCEILEKFFNYMPTEAPNFIMGHNGHYAQSVFVLTDVNKPTVITTEFDSSFAVDNSYLLRSNICKFKIPKRFNYSFKSMDLFDNGDDEHIVQDQESEISFFNSNSRKLHLTVSETGDYNLFVSDLETIAKKRFDNGDINANIYSSLEIFNKDKLFIYLKDCNGKTYKLDLSNKEHILNLHLDADRDNIFELQLGREIYDDGFYLAGASLTANLQKDYHQLLPNGKPQTCVLNENGKKYYLIQNPIAGLYNITVDNAEFDLYDADFRLLNRDQRANDILMLRNAQFYVCVKNGVGQPTITLSRKTEFTVLDNGITESIEVSLTEKSNTVIYPLYLSRTGIYSFEKLSDNNEIKLLDQDYTIQLKQEGSYREMLFGAKKAYLQSGTYYLLLKGTNNSVKDFVNISFSPQEIYLEKDITVMDDTYFTFIPLENGYYEFNLNGNAFSARLDGFSVNADNRYKLIQDQKYIIYVKKNVVGNANASLKVAYSPSTTTTYHNVFNDDAVTFVTNITGYYSFNGENIALYNKYLTLIDDGGGQSFTSSLVAGEKYYIINCGNKECVVNLEGEKLTANFEATIQAGDNQYFKFIAPEDGYYRLNTLYSDKVGFEIYSYENLSKNLAVEQTKTGYYLNEGCLYYIKINLSTTDFITVLSSNISSFIEIPEGTLAEVELNSDTLYAKSYKLIPTDSGNYTFIFNRNLKKEFLIYVDGEKYEFSRGSNVLKVTRNLSKENVYEIKFNLLSEGNATLIFGVYRHTEDFSVYVSNKLQDNSGLVNKIAIGEDRNDFVNEQITIGNLLGYASYTKVNYEVLNAPYVDGTVGVTIDANGLLTVSNKVSQWAAFAVEVNVGRVQYGDVIIDNGVSKIINFLIYVDIQDIKIFDRNDSVVYNIDIAPKQAIDLTAKVFPNHATLANTLTYYISPEDSKYVSLEKDGYNARIAGLYTTPNNTYVKIYAYCGDEFTVVIMVRVHAEIVNVYTANNVSRINGTSTAYELVLYNDISADIYVPEKVKYLKIKGNKKKLTNTKITVNSNDLTLVFEAVEITGSSRGLICSEKYKLEVYFVGDVKLCGASGDSSNTVGRSAISANHLTITKADGHLVEITGGNGFSPDSNYDVGGNGGVAISVTGKVEIFNIDNLKIIGGNGGVGAKGKDATSVAVATKPDAEHNKNGDTGEAGKNGGDGQNGGIGGVAISCKTLTVSNCANLYVIGGNGGRGGDGGAGSAGGNGGKGGSTDWGVMENAGNGGIGGKGGNGGRGGNGGVGSMALVGTVTINDSLLRIVAGNGGRGGNGGNGGNGGRGGNGGDDISLVGCEGTGGRGGNGGNAGQGGEGGRQGYNINISQYGVIQSGIAGCAGLVGIKGYGGYGGERGDTGLNDANVTAKAESGDNGTGRDEPAIKFA